jgi:hypothetical protein
MNQFPFPYGQKLNYGPYTIEVTETGQLKAYPTKVAKSNGGYDRNIPLSEYVTKSYIKECINKGLNISKRGSYITLANDGKAILTIKHNLELAIDAMAFRLPTTIQYK